MSDFASYYATLPDNDLLRLVSDASSLLPEAKITPGSPGPIPDNVRGHARVDSSWRASWIRNRIPAAQVRGTFPHTRPPP